MELLGPEYSMEINSLDAGPKVFFSREVVGETGEDLVEKQNAETGLMPVVADEEAEYGYIAENRHMVQAFRAGKRPHENFSDGLAVTELLMTAYMSAERGQTIPFPPPGLETFGDRPSPSRRPAWRRSCQPSRAASGTPEPDCDHGRASPPAEA
jgi:hypothetical protein